MSWLTNFFKPRQDQFTKLLIEQAACVVKGLDALNVYVTVSDQKAGGAKAGDAKVADLKAGSVKVGDTKVADHKSGSAKAGDAKVADHRMAAPRPLLPRLPISKLATRNRLNQQVMPRLSI